MLNLNNKTAIVTGGGRGIGRNVALTLARAGANVAICGRTRETLESTVQDLRALGVEAWSLVADVKDLAQVEAFVNFVVESAGGVDLLINNAVSSLSAPFDEQTDEHWQHHIDVKLMAYIRMARLCLPSMRERGSGRIVNIGGMTARIVAPLRITNGIVNAGVSNFTKQLANQVGKDGITVNCVHPGFTATDRMVMNVERRARDEGVSVESMLAETAKEMPLGRIIEPDDIANTVLFFCSSLAEMVTGQSIAVDGGSGTSINY